MLTHGDSKVSLEDLLPGPALGRLPGTAGAPYRIRRRAASELFSAIYQRGDDIVPSPGGVFAQGGWYAVAAR